MGWFKLPADESDFPGDSEERNQAGLAAAGALCNQEDIIKDWGDFDGDYSEEVHRKRNGQGPSGRSDVHCSSAEDIQAYYDSCRAQNIKIRKQGQ